MNRLTLAPVSLAGLILLSACSSGPLAATCSDFESMSNTRQMEAAKAWVGANKDGPRHLWYDNKSEAEKAEYVRDTLDGYCSARGNADKKLDSLEPGITFGT